MPPAPAVPTSSRYPVPLTEIIIVDRYWRYHASNGPRCLGGPGLRGCGAVKCIQFGSPDAYEIQLLQVARWTADGARIRGHKVGLTSPAMQRQFSVDQPDYGHLLDRMFWPEYDPIPLSGFLQPRVEPETAFVLARTGRHHRRQRLLGRSGAGQQPGRARRG